MKLDKRNEASEEQPHVVPKISMRYDLQYTMHFVENIEKKAPDVSTVQ